MIKIKPLNITFQLMKSRNSFHAPVENFISNVVKQYNTIKVLSKYAASFSWGEDKWES